MFKEDEKCETDDEKDYDIIESPDAIKKLIKHSADVIYKEEINLNDSESVKETKNKEIMLPEKAKNNQITKKQSPDEITNLTLTNENAVVPQNINLNVSKLQENDVKETDSLIGKETETDSLIVKEPEIENLTEKNNDTYFKNRKIILLNSMLLGVSYSIIWPTLWPYIGEFGKNKLNRFMYCVTYIAYPCSSAFSAFIVNNLNKFEEKKILLLLNFLQVVGNLVYMLNYYSFLPLVGRFVAGLGDSWYYVILLEQTKSSSSLISNRKMATECLASFVIGIILSPGINVIASYLKFDVFNFRMNGGNSSGLVMASLFFIMLLNNAFFLKGYSSKIESKKSRLFPQNKECATENNLFVQIVVTGIYFLYYFVVTFLELMIPILIYEKMKLSVIGSIHVYAIISVLYGLILIIIVQISQVKYLQIFLTLSSIIEAASIIVVYILHQNSHIASNIEHTIIFFSPVCFSLALLWANSDGLFISLLQTYVSEDVRDCTHSTGKRISKLAIVWAVITVVFYSPKTSTIITMTIMTLILIAYVAQLFIYYRKIKLNPINKGD